MGADLHAVQAAVILAAAVVLAGGYGAVDAVVGFFHNETTPFGGFGLVTAVSMPFYPLHNSDSVPKVYPISFHFRMTSSNTCALVAEVE